MMTLKFSKNAKVTRALTGQRPVCPAAYNDFIMSKKASENRKYLKGNYKELNSWEHYTTIVLCSRERANIPQSHGIK